MSRAQECVLSLFGTQERVLSQFRTQECVLSLYWIQDQVFSFNSYYFQGKVEIFRGQAKRTA